MVSSIRKISESSIRRTTDFHSYTKLNLGNNNKLNNKIPEKVNLAKKLQLSPEDNFTNTENKKTKEVLDNLANSFKAVSIKIEDEQIDDLIDSLNDKKDFYEYNEECFKKCNKVIIPQKDEIKDFLIELPFLEEMRKNKLKLAVWDLDETLIHCIQDEPHKADIQLEIKFSSKSIKRVRIKPYNK